MHQLRGMHTALSDVNHIQGIYIIVYLHPPVGRARLKEKSLFKEWPDKKVFL